MTELPAEQAFLGYTAKIVPELADHVRPMTDATPHPENVRKHNLEKLAQSLQRHGQRAVIIVQTSTGYIVKGNGTYAAAQMLGWDRLAMSFQEMTDDMALGYLYDDNRASDLATYDRRKLRDGLAKMQEQPGLFDEGLWTIEEFEDLDEELAGATILDPQDSKAAFATASGESKATVKPPLPGERMRDVSIVLTIADHTLFVERLKRLAKIYQTGGTIATIVEAVKRQAAAEGQPVVGRALDEEAEYAAKREVVKELRDYVSTMGLERSFSGTWLMAQLERIVPYRNQKQTDVAPGQTGAWEEPGSVPTVSDGVGQVEAATGVAAGQPVTDPDPSPREAFVDDVIRPAAQAAAEELVTDLMLDGDKSAEFDMSPIWTGVQPDPAAAALVDAGALATELFSDDELEQAQRDAVLAEIDDEADER